MEESEDLRRATELWRAAYRYQMEGKLDRAIEHYQRSVAIHPTAEAHTFLGWSMSFQGRLEEATAECLRAIEIDPVGRKPLVPPLHSVTRPPGSFSDHWGWRKSGTPESQSPHIRRSPAMLRTVSISATIRRRAPTRQTPQSFGQRRQRHADGFIELLELVQMDLEAARERPQQLGG